MTRNAFFELNDLKLGRSSSNYTLDKILKFQTGCLSSRVSRRGDGVEICSLASLTDLPPSYSMLHIEADPPKYGELFQPLSSSRQTV